MFQSLMLLAVVFFILVFFWIQYRIFFYPLFKTPFRSSFIPWLLTITLLWFFFTLWLCPFFQEFPFLNNKYFSFYDSFSLYLVLLTALLTPICMYIGKGYKHYVIYCWLFVLMEIFLIFCFLTHNILIFYISFEVVTALMFVVVLYWGYEQRRSLASFYFFYFTFFSSLFFLMGISALYYHYGDVTWYDLLDSKTPKGLQLFVWWCFAFAFAVKIPMFPFHVWLPEAHVEAPTGGSIMLAAVLLKLGFYGFYKFLIPLFFLVSLKYSTLVLTFALISIIHAMLTAIRQIDAKRIVAYCSIAHMNLGILALFSFTAEGFLGSTFGMLAHGIVSAGLFFSVGALYKRYGTRSINYYGGLVRYMPLFTIFFFLFILGNIAFPLTINFIAEFQMMVSIITISYVAGLLSIFGIVLNLFTSLMLFVKVCYGSWKSFYLKYFCDLTYFEFLTCYFLSFLMFFYGVYSYSDLDDLTQCNSVILEIIRSVLNTSKVHAEGLDVSTKFSYVVESPLSLIFGTENLFLTRFNHPWFVNFFKKIEHFSFSLCCFNAYSPCIDPDLEQALRYSALPKPSFLTKRVVIWPHDFYFYDTGVCFEYASLLSYYAQNLLKDNPFSYPAFFWYSAHKPVFAALYESLNDIVVSYTLSPSLQRDIRVVLKNMLCKSEYPDLLFLSRLVEELNLPKSNLLSLLSLEGYPKLPDFEVIVRDVHHLKLKDFRGSMFYNKS